MTNPIAGKSKFPRVLSAKDSRANPPGTPDLPPDLALSSLKALVNATLKTKQLPLAELLEHFTSGSETEVYVSMEMTVGDFDRSSRN